MKWHNTQILNDMLIALFSRFGVKGLVEKIDELEKRLEAVESRPKPGRPRKDEQKIKELGRKTA